MNQQNMMYNRIWWHFWTMLENFHFLVFFFLVKSWELHFGNFFFLVKLVVAIWLLFREKLSILYGKMRGWNGLSYHWGRRKVPNRRWERNSPIMLLFRTSRRKGYDRIFSCLTYVQGVSFEKWKSILSAVCLQFC